jgi:ADP-ribosylglycohydrolase
LHATLQGAQSGLAELKGREWDGDPCDFGGQGWRAHECLATALLCADLFPRDPIAALRRATVTGGDSDSIAAVAGAILGAVHDKPWPAEWFDRLEPRYQQWILEAEGYVFT